MPGAQTSAALASRPGPQEDRPAANAAAPGRIGSLLGLVRKLIDYGKNLAGSLQQRAAATNPLDFMHVKTSFGTTDIALILARITRGLLLAAALEVRLVSRVAREAARPETYAPGADSPGKATPMREPSPRKPRAARAAAPQAARRADDLASLLARMPTAEEIAAMVRGRPIGAVIADICSDLGIVTSHPLWRELHEAVLFNGGSLLRMIRNLFERTRLTNFFPPDTPLIPPMPPGWQPPPRPLFAAAVGAGPP